MANTYSQIYIQFIFAVKGRESQILESHEKDFNNILLELYEVKEQKLLAIYANPDHIHFHIGLDLIN